MISQEDYIIIWDSAIESIEDFGSFDNSLLALKGSFKRLVDLAKNSPRGLSPKEMDNAKNLYFLMLNRYSFLKNHQTKT